MTLTAMVSRTARWLGNHALILFILWSTWLALPYFIAGGSSYVRLHDTGDAHIPSDLALVPTIANGLLGYWDPQRAAGVDRLATGPIKFDAILFALFPSWLTYAGIIWVQRLIAGYFLFRLLKDNLGIGLISAIFAGLAYALFSQVTINLQRDGFTLYDGLALPGLPFLVWSLSRIDMTNRIRPFLYAVALGAVLSFGSQFAFALFLTPFVLVWFGLIVPQRQWMFWRMLFVLGAAWLIAEAPALWASLSNAPLSQRAAWGLDSPLTSDLSSQIAFALGLIYDNAIAFGLIGLALFMTRLRERRLLVLTIVIFLCLGWIGGYSWIRQAVYEHAAWLAGFQLDRVYLIVPLLATVAGSLGLHLIGDERSIRLPGQALRRLRIKTILATGAIGIVGLQSLAIKPAMFKDLALGRNFTALYAQPDLKQLADQARGQLPFRVATVFDPAWPLHPAYAWAYGLESADGYLNLYPKRYQDFWEEVIAPLTRTDRERYDYFHYWGNRIYLFSPTSGFPAQHDVRFDDYYDLKLLSLANVRYIISAVSLRSDALTLLPSSVRNARADCAILTPDMKVVAMLRGQCIDGPPLYVYENRLAFPRAFLAGRVQVFETTDETLAALRQASYTDLQSTAYLTKADMAGAPLDDLVSSTGNAYLNSYAADRIVVETQTTRPMILIVTNSYSPYWQARIDELDEPLLPVDHAFQGIHVPAGQHRVTLQYKPPYALR